MDPLIIPFTFAGLLAVAGLVILVLDHYQQRRERSKSK